MNIFKIKKEFNNGKKIKLVFWPEGLTISKNDHEGLYEKCKKIYGKPNYGSKILLKSLFYYLSNKWEVVEDKIEVKKVKKHKNIIKKSPKAEK